MKVLVDDVLRVVRVSGKRGEYYKVRVLSGDEVITLYVFDEADLPSSGSVINLYVQGENLKYRYYPSGVEETA